MTTRGIPATPQRTKAGLLPERADHRLETAHAKARRHETRAGQSVRLEVSALRPLDAEGPVDLTIYGPKRRLPARYRPRYPLDPVRYAVVVEATLEVDARGRASFVFRSVRDDIPGVYVAVFRRTDFSSSPVARCSFVVVPAGRARRGRPKRRTQPSARGKSR